MNRIIVNQNIVKAYEEYEPKIESICIKLSAWFGTKKRWAFSTEIIVLGWLSKSSNVKCCLLIILRFISVLLQT